MIVMNLQLTLFQLYYGLHQKIILKMGVISIDQIEAKLFLGAVWPKQVIPDSHIFVVLLHKHVEIGSHSQ